MSVLVPSQIGFFYWKIHNLPTRARRNLKFSQLTVANKLVECWTKTEKAATLNDLTFRAQMIFPCLLNNDFFKYPLRCCQRGLMCLRADKTRIYRHLEGISKICLFLVSIWFAFRRHQTKRDFIVKLSYAGKMLIRLNSEIWNNA